MYHNCVHLYERLQCVSNHWIIYKRLKHLHETHARFVIEQNFYYQAVIDLFPSTLIAYLFWRWTRRTRARCLYHGDVLADASFALLQLQHRRFEAAQERLTEEQNLVYPETHLSDFLEQRYESGITEKKNASLVLKFQSPIDDQDRSQSREKHVSTNDTAKFWDIVKGVLFNLCKVPF